MTEYIKREDALRAVKHAWAKGIEPSEYIEDIEAADVAPVVYADLLDAEVSARCGSSKLHGVACSECLTFAPGTIPRKWKYCPNCGAMLDGGADNG